MPSGKVFLIDEKQQTRLVEGARRARGCLNSGGASTEGSNSGSMNSGGTNNRGGGLDTKQEVDGKLKRRQLRISWSHLMPSSSLVMDSPSLPN